MGGKIDSDLVTQTWQDAKPGLDQASANQEATKAKQAAAVQNVRNATLDTAGQEIVERIGQHLLDEIAAGRHPYPGIARTVERPMPSAGAFEGSDPLVGATGFVVKLDNTPAWEALGDVAVPTDAEMARLEATIGRELQARGFELIDVKVHHSGMGKPRTDADVYLRDPEFESTFGPGSKFFELVRRWTISSSRSQRMHVPELLFPTGSRDSFAYSKAF